MEEQKLIEGTQPVVQPIATEMSRKRHRNEAKAEKAAKIAAADKMAQEYFLKQMSAAGCAGCKELRRNVEEKSAEIASMALELADMTAAKKAKQVVINDLHRKIEQMEADNKQLREGHAGLTPLKGT